MDKDTYDLIQTITAIATSIGTVGAVILSLVYSMKDRKVGLDVIADLVYVPFKKNGKPGDYVISIDSADTKVMGSMFESWKIMLRIGALNTGSTQVYINGFYFYTVYGGNTNLFIDSSKALDGTSIGGAIQPGQMFSMYFPINILRGKHVLETYSQTKFAKIRFRIAAETSLGKKFHSSMNSNVHLAIAATIHNKTQMQTS